MALVVAYHVWFGRVSGGVDVFLLLSGFFIGASLWRSLEADRPARVMSRLTRRIWRLVPAAVTVLIATAAAVVLVRPSALWSEAAREIVASLAFYENWLLIAQQREYDALGDATSLWQHFWSLSIQGQLFLVVPVVVWVIHRWGRGLRDRRIGVTAAVSVAFGASFLAAQVAMQSDQAAAYYSTATRAWEFLAGMLLAIVLAAWTPSGRAWRVAGVAGLALMLATGALVDGASQFPGWATLVPVGAAALIVIAGALPGEASAPSVTRVLSWPPLAAAGKYAYALYLWHWPVLVLHVELRGEVPGLWDGLVLVVASAALAVATYHLVEQPLQSGGARGWARTVVAAGAVLLVVASAGWLAVERQRVDAGLDAAQDAVASVPTASGDSSLGADTAIGSEPQVVDYPGALVVTQPERYAATPGLAPVPDPAVAYYDFPADVYERCRTQPQDREVTPCEFGDGSVDVAVVGGSHLAQWAPAILAYGEAHDWTVTTYFKAGCPVVSHPEDELDPSCQPWRDEVLGLIAAREPDIVVVKYSATRFPADVDGVAEDVAPADLRALAGAVGEARVLGIRDNRRFDKAMPECFARGAECGEPLVGDGGLAAVDPAREVGDFFGAGQFAAVDLNDVACPDGWCEPVQGNVLVFRDDDHLSETYVLTLIPEFSRRVEEALG